MTASFLKQDPKTKSVRVIINKRSFEPFCVWILYFKQSLSGLLIKTSLACKKKIHNLFWTLYPSLLYSSEENTHLSKLLLA